MIVVHGYVSCPPLPTGRRIVDENRGRANVCVCVCYGDCVFQVKSLVTKSSVIEHESTKSLSLGNMTKEVAHNTKMIFMPPILKYTSISIVINLSFHIGYVRARPPAVRTSNFFGFFLLNISPVLVSQLLRTHDVVPGTVQ